jgi:hypothetical protein
MTFTRCNLPQALGDPTSAKAAADGTAGTNLRVGHERRLDFENGLA